MQKIIYIKYGLWKNLFLIVFALGLATLAVWLDYKTHGDISVVVMLFSALFVAFCYLPMKSIIKPSFRLLAVEGDHLVWRIFNPKNGSVSLERRVPINSIRGLKWWIPKPPNSRTGQDFTNAQLRFITAGRNSETLPDEFFAARYRTRIETALKQKHPHLKIVEEFESRSK